MSGSFLLSDKLERYIHKYGINETNIEEELRLLTLKEYSKCIKTRTSAIRKFNVNAVKTQNDNPFI